MARHCGSLFLIKPPVSVDEMFLRIRFLEVGKGGFFWPHLPSLFINRLFCSGHYMQNLGIFFGTKTMFCITRELFVIQFEG